MKEDQLDFTMGLEAKPPFMPRSPNSHIARGEELGEAMVDAFLRRTAVLEQEPCSKCGVVRSHSMHVYMPTLSGVPAYFPYFGFGDSRAL